MANTADVSLRYISAAPAIEPTFARTRGASFGIAALAVIATLVLSAGAAFAQSANLEVAWTTDSVDLTVGDPFVLTISADHPDGYHVVFPSLPDEWEGFEVRSQTPLPTVANADGTLTTAQMYEMALFQPGNYPTPEVSVSFRQPDGQIVSRTVQPLRVRVNSVLQAGDEELRDIKPQSNLAVPSLWPWGVGGAAAVALLILAAVLLWHRLRPDAVLQTGPVDTRTPFEVAMGQLDQIEALDLLAHGSYKEHFTLISNTVRAYLLGEYLVPAHDLTTTETARAVRSSAVPSGPGQGALSILRTCDIVKFTELTPMTAASHESVRATRAAIEALRPAPIVEPAGLEPAKAASA